MKSLFISIIVSVVFLSMMVGCKNRTDETFLNTIQKTRIYIPYRTLSCPDRNMEVFNQLSHYEGLRLLSSVCGWKLIQQTRIIDKRKALMS